MTSSLKKYSDHLRVLARGTPSMQKAVIKNADSGLIKCISECALNILKGNVPISPHQKSKLTRYKKDLRSLAQRRVSLKSRKRVLQKGGFLGAILAPIITGVLGSLVGRSFG